MGTENAGASPWFQLIEKQDTIAIAHKLRKHAGERNFEGLTALMFAAQHNLQDSIKALLKAEATLTTEDGYTALMLAASLGNYVACELLLHAEGSIKLEDGRSALFLAASGNHDKCVFLLTQYFGSTRDIYGRTVLDHCVSSDSFQAAEAYVKSAFVRNIYLLNNSSPEAMLRSAVKIERGGKHEPELDPAFDSTIHRYTSLLLNEIIQAAKYAEEQENEEMREFLEFVQDVVKHDHFFRFRGLYAEYRLNKLKKEQSEITSKYFEQMEVNETSTKVISNLQEELQRLRSHKGGVSFAPLPVETVHCAVQTHGVETYVDQTAAVTAAAPRSADMLPAKYSSDESALHKKILEQEATIRSLRKAVNVLSAEKLALLSPTGRTALELERENEMLINSVGPSKSRSPSADVAFVSRPRSTPAPSHSQYGGSAGPTLNTVYTTQAPVMMHPANASRIAHIPSPPLAHQSQQNSFSRSRPSSPPSYEDQYTPSPGVKIVPISPPATALSVSGASIGMIPRPMLDSPADAVTLRRKSVEDSATNPEVDLESRLAQFTPNITMAKDEAYYHNIVSVDRNTYSRLMRAVLQKNKTLLVSTLGESTHTSQLGVSAMMLAVKMRSIEIVRILKLKSLRISMKCGYTALMECCKNGYAEMICHLMAEAGMQTKQGFQWGEGCTALMIACYYGHVDCAQQLLAAEGHINTPSGIRPRDFCSSPEMLDLLGERSIGGPCFSKLEPLYPLF